MTQQALLDTSVFIASESGRGLDLESLPEQGFVSVITLAELEAGVLTATNTDSRAQRLATLQAVSVLTPLAIDRAAASHWARLRVELHEAGGRVNVNNLWIASVALAHDLPVLTQDADFDVLAELDLLRVLRL